MSDSLPDGSNGATGDAPQAAAVTAGGLLKQARLAKGMHIAALATLIKVTPRKLELLESDRFDELPGATFTRALAQTVCRTLKIDATPVLALLPQANDGGLSQMSMGLNAPYRDKPGRRTPNELPFMKSPVVLGAGVLVVASVALYLLPSGWISQLAQPGASNGEATTAVVPPPPVVTTVPEVASTTVPSAPPASETVMASAATSTPAIAAAASAAASTVSAAVAPNDATPAASAPSGALLVRASAQTWVEVVDGRGLQLLSRHLEAGEAVGLDGPSPLRVTIGNASATQVSFKGKPVELNPSRGNVAKLELR